MSEGTISLTHGSDAVVGAGVDFTKGLSGADFIVVTVGGTAYSLAVETVIDATHATLSAPFTGPTATGVAWQAVPRKTMLRVTAELNNQVTEALRISNENAMNWQAVFSNQDTVTVILPDGTTQTGFSWKKITDLLTALDKDHLDATAAQVHSDAQQVATDTAAVTAHASQVAADAAQVAADAAQVAQDRIAVHQDAQAAAQSETNAAASAAAAHSDAQAVNPANILHVDQNFADVADKPLARNNLSVFSRAEIADLLPGYLGQVDWQGMRGQLEPGTAPRDGQQVSQTGIFADLYAKGLAGKLPTCTEAEWQANPLKRGCYVLDSAAGMMRLPDDNGVQPGSLPITVKVGDKGSVPPGTMGGSALPNITGVIKRLSATLAPVVNDVAVTDGAFSVGKRETEVTPPTQVPGVATAATGRPLIFKASDSNSIYSDNATEIQPNRQNGCWTVRFAAKATNGGSIDALALATAIAAGDAELLAKIIATNDRLDYALISPATNPALGTRTIYENPFGNNTPVFCVAEVYQSTLSEWINTGQTYASAASVWGLRAGYSEGKGIVLVVGNTGYNIGSTMGNFATNSSGANYTTVSPVRIHVWKITA